MVAYCDIVIFLGTDSSKLVEESVRIVEEYNNKYAISDSLSKSIEDVNSPENSIDTIAEDVL